MLLGLQYLLLFLIQNHWISKVITNYWFDSILSCFERVYWRDLLVIHEPSSCWKSAFIISLMTNLWYVGETLEKWTQKMWENKFFEAKFEILLEISVCLKISSVSLIIDWKFDDHSDRVIFWYFLSVFNNFLLINCLVFVEVEIRNPE